MKLISFLLLITALTTPAFAKLSCVNLLYPNSTPKLLSTNKKQDLLPALISRFKSVYKTPDFDIRIVSDSLTDHDFSPRLLKEMSITKFTDLTNKIIDVGFRPTTYLHFLVESKQNSIKLFASKDSKSKWKKNDMSAFLAYSGYQMGVPGFFRHKAFPTKSSSRFRNKKNQTLVITAISKNYHPLVQDFVTAHELAHSTENRNSHSSLIWSEARADLIAYFVTGANEVIIPETQFSTVFSNNGEAFNKNIIFKRSLSDPDLVSINTIIPNPDAYHLNSQIISSVLYRASKKIGNKKIVKFIQWMDNHRPENSIPKTEWDGGDNSSSRVKYVSKDDSVERVSTFIYNEVGSILNLAIEWAHTSEDLTEVDKESVLQEIKVAFGGSQ